MLVEEVQHPASRPHLVGRIQDFGEHITAEECATSLAVSDMSGFSPLTHLPPAWLSP
ncbi:hypothetical protein [Streptomyces sp. NRRL S-1521]|uniref:hypothetical protein n=1 Tax=Streptomyces sp. NRRL S-1521 TaxID=1609100 RepID=UPI000ADA9215|nr:hypothetical protein [Streptomyces sp. NRRL S-1521]